jgi:hypothetical protein
VGRILVGSVGLATLVPDALRDPVPTGSTANDLASGSDLTIARTTDLNIAGTIGTGITPIGTGVTGVPQFVA